MKPMSSSLAALAAALALGCGITAAHAVPVVYATGGSNAAAIQSTVDAFRAALGTLNSNVAGSFGSGRREINWDGVPDAFAAPNALPANFFNANSPRGVVFSTAGSSLQVSANAANASAAPIEFGNLNASYGTLFQPFSAQKLFTAIGSNVVDVSFFVPGSTTAATVSAFGVVFSDVDLAATTSVQFFSAGGSLLTTAYAPAVAGNETLSFVGVLFNGGERVGRVRITAGNAALGGNETATTDLVVMDDFIYAEPLAAPVPEPAPAALLAAGLAALALMLGSAGTARAAGAAKVTFDHPERYADVGTGALERERATSSLAGWLRTLAQRLPDGQTLEVEIADIDLAGTVEPTARGQEVRIVRGGADWPRIALRYRLVDAGGRTLKGGEARLSNMDYLAEAATARDAGELAHEKRLLQAWFEQTFEGASR